MIIVTFNPSYDAILDMNPDWATPTAIKGRSAPDNYLTICLTRLFGTHTNLLGLLNTYLSLYQYHIEAYIGLTK